MVVIGGDIMQQRRQRAVACAVGVHDLLRAAHIRRDVRIDTQRINAILMAHRAAEFILVELGNRPRQERMLRFTLRFLFGEARHIETRRACGAQHQVDPVQRFIRRGERIGDTGQRFRFFFIHRQNRNVFLEELLPPLRVVSNHVFRSQRQHHRHIMLFGILNGFHRRVRHRLARLTAHEVGGQHQRGSAGNHLFRNAFRTQLVHVARTDGKGTFAAIANQRKTAANGAINALKVVQISTAGGIAQVAISVAADLDVAAHHAEQHRAVVRQHRIIVHGIANGAAGKLMGDQAVAYQFLIQRFGDIIFNYQRMTGAQAVAYDKRLIHFRFDIH